MTSEHNNNKSNTNRPSIVSHSTTEHSKQAIKRYIFDVPSEYPNKKRDKNTGLIFKCFKADSNLKFKKKKQSAQALPGQYWRYIFTEAPVNRNEVLQGDV